MQPGEPIAIPERGGSLPPLHFHPSRPLNDVLLPSSPSAVMNPSAPKRFPWTHLPGHIQQRILSCAILPDGSDTALIVGNPDHSTYLQKVAVPILLALGSWTGYCDAVCILYRNVQVNLCIHRRSSVTFLTSAHALRPRSMVVKLRMILDIKKSLPLFDTGHTIRQSKGKLIKINVPTALRCMKVHGRLSKVEFLIDSLAAMVEREQHVPEDYLPMAEIHLVNRGVLQMWDDCMASSSFGKRPSTRQAETVIAPAFLACRAWQSGFLPLFEDGTFQNGATLALLPNRNQDDRNRITGEDLGNTISRVDGANLMRFWLGGTIVELLDETVHPASWIDPFTLSNRRADDLDGIGRSIQNRQNDSSPREDAVGDSSEIENELPPPAAKAPDSPSESASTSGETGCEEQHGAMNLQKRLYGTRLGHSASHDAPGPSKGYNTPSDDGSVSDEVEMRNLHRRYGVGSRVRENTSSVSPSSSESPAHSALIGGTASPSSESELD